MAQLFLKVVQLGCGLPLGMAYVVGPVIASLMPVNPLNIIVYLAWLLGLRFSKSNRFGGTWKNAARWAALFYFALMLPLYLVLLAVTCRAAS